MKKSLIALAFGTLALGMSEFVMMGILPDIARSLGVSIPEAGHLISAYALGVCFGAPLMVLVARKRPLKLPSQAPRHRSVSIMFFAAIRGTAARTPRASGRTA